MKRFFLCGLFCGRRRAAGCLRRTEYILCRSTGHGTPTSSTSRTQKSDSTVKVNETAAKVEVVTAQSSATPEAPPWLLPLPRPRPRAISPLCIWPVSSG